MSKVPFDERQETLREVAALGNIRTVQHLLRAGVHPDAQNKVNGWTALHWAAARGHERVVAALLGANAKQDILSTQGKTAADVAKGAGVLALLGGDNVVEETGEEATTGFKPNYLTNPELARVWGTPEEIIPATMAMHGSGPVQTMGQDVVEDTATRELLVYDGERAEGRLLGAVFVSEGMTTIEGLGAIIAEEIDGVGEGARLARHNGHSKVPLGQKQGAHLVQRHFSGADDVVIVLPPS